MWDTLLDSATNYIVTNVIYDTGDETTITQFLKESNQPQNIKTSFTNKKIKN